MHIRKLTLEDAPLMLEWMHDDNVVEMLRGDFASKTLADAQQFIECSMGEESVNFAIASDLDEYMGTVSLKNIDWDDKNAEFAIAIRRKAMGLGYSWFGMKSILKMAFEEYNLKSVYWCVSNDNLRAVRFYEKHHFRKMNYVPKKVLGRYEGCTGLEWYVVFDDDIKPFE